MPIYKGSDQITKLYHGSTAIGRVYHGSTLVFDSAASGGGEALVNFANDGATFPGYGPATFPAGIYVSSTQTTWLARESYLGNTRGTRVTTYDHASGVWGADSNIALRGLTDDDHGVPALFRDADGRIHVFGGAHESGLRHSVTRDPDDNSFWIEKATIGSTYTYPHPVFDGTNLYLFLRDTVSGHHGTGVLLKSTAISSGDITFATKVTLVDFGTDSRFYLGNTHDDGTYIHLIATRSDALDTFRRDIYHFRYKKSDGSISNADGSHSVATGSLPIGISDANTYYRIVDQSTASTYGNIPTFCADTSGDFHLVYRDGASATGSSWDLKHMIYDAGTPSWGSASTVVSVTNANRYDMIAVGPLSAGGVELLYPDNDGTYTRGGTTMKRMAYSGSWGFATTLLTGSNGKALDVPARVLNAHDDLRHHFYEIDQTSTDSGAGGLLGYAYGAGGLVDRTIPANPDGFTWMQLDFTGAADGTTSFDSPALFYKTLTASGNAQATSGKLELDGTGDFISTADDDIWSLLNYDFTLDVLGVTFDINNREQHLLSHYSSSARGWSFNHDGAGHLRFMGGSPVVVAQVSFTPTVGTRHDLAAVRSGNTVYFYSGANLIGSAAFSVTINNSNPPLIVGSFSGAAAGSFDLNGRIEKVRLRVQTADYTGSTRTVPSW